MKNFAEFVAANREKIYKLAEENTKRNSNGDAVISRSDTWFYEDEWDEYFSGGGISVEVSVQHDCTRS